MASASSTSSKRKEVMGLHRITKKALLDLCRRDNLFQTPRLNDVLYLHYQGFQYIECLEEYTDLKCLWLDCNAITEIQGLEQQTKLKCLFLQSNLIKRIENLSCCAELDTLNLSMNHIRKIENINSDVLPVLNTLNIASNYLKDSESLAELANCKQLSVVDLSNNRIDDILIVKVFEQMPNLHVLVLQGNPVVSRLPQYRKTLTLACKELTYLDSRPVFPRDRACAEAWKRGGYDEERRENNRWNRMDRQKIRDSVNSTIRLRNKHRPSDKQEPLLTSTDSEDEAEADERARNNRVRAAIENGNAEDIWKEVIENPTAEPSALKLDNSSSTTSAESASESSGESSTHSKDSLIAEQMSNRDTLTDGIKRKENVLDVAEVGNVESILKLVKTKETAPKVPIEETSVRKVLIEEIKTSYEVPSPEASDSGKLIPIEEVTFTQNAKLEFESTNKLIIETAEVAPELIVESVEILKPEASVPKVICIEDATCIDNIKLETAVECNDASNVTSDLSDAVADEPILIEELGIVEPNVKLTDVMNVKENIMLERNLNVDEAVIKDIVERRLLDGVIEQTSKLNPAKKPLIEEIQSATSSGDEEEYEKTRKVLADLSRNNDPSQPEMDETKQGMLKHIDNVYQQIAKESESSQPLEELLNEPSDYVPFQHDFDNALEPVDLTNSDVEAIITAKAITELQYEEDCATANEKVESDMQALLKNIDYRIGELIILENETPSNVSSVNSQEEQFSEAVVASARKSSQLLVNSSKTDLVADWKTQTEPEKLKLDVVSDANVCLLFNQAKQLFDEAYNDKKQLSLINKENVIELKTLINYTRKLIDAPDSQMHSELVREDEILQNIIEQLEAVEAAKQTSDPMLKQNVYECDTIIIKDNVEDNLNSLPLANNVLVTAAELSQTVLTYQEETELPETTAIGIKIDDLLDHASETNETMEERDELHTREEFAAQSNAEVQLRENVSSVEPEAKEDTATVNSKKLEFAEEPAYSGGAWDIIDTEVNVEQTTNEINSETNSASNDDTNFTGNAIALPLTDDEKAILTIQNPLLTATELEASIIYEERRLQLEKADLELHQLLQECEDEIDELYDRNNDALNAQIVAKDEPEDGSSVCQKLLNEMLDELAVEVKKPSSYDFGVIESDEEYSYSESKVNEESNDDQSGGKSIRECMDAFDDFLSALDNSVQQRTLGVRKLKVPSTVEEKIKSANALLQSPNLAELNTESQDDINTQVAEMEARRKRHVQHLTERCYAQRDKYNDTLEVVDGRLVIVKKDTGEISELTPPPGFSYSDEDEFGSKSATSEDYDTADEADEVMQRSNTRGMWTKPYKPTARKSAEHLITAALQRHAQAMKQDDEAKSDDDTETETEDDQFYSMENDTDGVFSNIDAEFFRKLNMVELHTVVDSDEHLVACARSYNELQRCLKRSRKELRLTAEENDMLKCMLPLEYGAGGDNQTEDERLLRKLVERTRAQEVRENTAHTFEHMLDTRPSCSKQNTWPVMGHLVRGAAELYDNAGGPLTQPASPRNETEKVVALEQSERSAISESSDSSDEESAVQEENYNAEGSNDEEEDNNFNCFKKKASPKLPENILLEETAADEHVTMIAPPNLPAHYLLRSEMETEETQSDHEEFSLREYCRHEYEQRENTDDEFIAAFRRSLLRPAAKNYVSDDDDDEIGQKRSLPEKHETMDQLPESLEKQQKLIQSIKWLHQSETAKAAELNANPSGDEAGVAATATEILASALCETKDLGAKKDENIAEDETDVQQESILEEPNVVEPITNASLSGDEDKTSKAACSGLNVANQSNMGSGVETVEDDVEVLDSCTEIYFKRNDVNAEMAEMTAEHVLMVKPAWQQENFAKVPDSVVGVASDVDRETAVSVEQSATNMQEATLPEPNALAKDALDPADGESCDCESDVAANGPQQIECNLEILNDDDEIVSEMTVNANIVYKF